MISSRLQGYLLSEHNPPRLLPPRSLCMGACCVKSPSSEDSVPVLPPEERSSDRGTRKQRLLQQAKHTDGNDRQGWGRGRSITDAASILREISEVIFFYMTSLICKC